MSQVTVPAAGRSKACHGGRRRLGGAKKLQSGGGGDAAAVVSWESGDAVADIFLFLAAVLYPHILVMALDNYTAMFLPDEDRTPGNMIINDILVEQEWPSLPLMDFIRISHSVVHVEDIEDLVAKCFS